MKESKYLKKEDCGEGGLVVTINRIEEANVAMENQPPEMKYVMYFNELGKGIVLNWTNLQLCANATGSDDKDNWPGKQIIIYNDPSVSFGGNVTGGIRIKSANQAQAAAPAAPVSMPTQAVPVPVGDDGDDLPFS